MGRTMMASVKLNSAVDKTLGRVKNVLRKLAGMPGKLKVYGKKGGALVSEAFSKLSNSPKKHGPSEPGTDQRRSPLKSKSQNARTSDERFQELIDIWAEIDPERSTEIQDENAIESTKNLTEATPVTTKKNAKKLTRVPDQAPTRGPAVNSIDRKIEQLSKRLDGLERDQSTRVHPKDVIESYGNLAEAARATERENARKLTRVRDQTPTGGPAISKSANGDSIDRELKALSDQLAEVDLERSTQIQDENDIDCYGNLTEAAPVTTRKKAREPTSAQEQVSTAGPATLRIAPEEDPETLEYLRPLLAVAGGRLDHKPICSFTVWADQLSQRYELVKMGEGAFGETYRLQRKSEDPAVQVLEEIVFKIIPLRARSGIGSRSGIRVSEAVSEIELLTKMTPVPGFTRFHEAYIMRGIPPPQIAKARAVYQRLPKTSQTDRRLAKRYPTTQLWVVMEMQYAGSDLERTRVTSNWQKWDLFWGVAIALARAEQFVEFEHRDLHLGNICVKSSRANGTMDGPLEITKKESKEVKLGFSGLEVTLIDYTLSRANIGPDHVAFFDLENVRGIFDQIGDIQYDIYRNMRAEVCLGDPLGNYDDVEAGSTKPVGGWRGFHPRTNLLWLYYLLSYRHKVSRYPMPGSDTKKSSSEKRAQQLRELLGERLDSVFEKLAPETMSESGLTSAGDLVQYAVNNGWLNASDLTD